ncbi:putative zinc transporter protein [Senna tora]|uniref:Putative zinc transporter protein n=1 Tax=Senna tora TaxID=362788 RepID=A0A834W3F5_9FABA|nr:putative zinc transporter protein [Senna tora]
MALELFYFPELSLWGLLLCGFLLYVAVRELDPLCSKYLGSGEEFSESFTSMIMKPVRHILSERKSRKIALFLLINTAYMVVEFVGGFMSNSLGLISDACHMLFDCAALAIGLYASYISRLPANNQYNYGRGRFEVLSGYANAVFLVLVGALIVLESFERILDPQEISTNSLLVVSIGGLLVNVIGLIFFHEEHHHAHGGSGSCSHAHSKSHSHHDHHHHHHHDQHCHGKHNNEGHRDHDSHHNHHHDADHHCHESSLEVEKFSQAHHCEVVCSSMGTCDSQLENAVTEYAKKPQEHGHFHIDHNMEGIFLHVLADTLGSVGVVISTLLIKYKGWLIADPACSIFISVLIISSVIPLLRNSAEILLQRVPRMHEKELKAALNDVLRIKGVYGIQRFHVWSFTNTDVVGTMHLHVSSDADKTSAKSQVSHVLHNAGIKDLTLQVECVK